MFTRLQNRNATTDIDGVYFNPAGFTRLGDGFFASVNNQTITQTQKVGSNYQYLTGQPKEYIGDVRHLFSQEFTWYITKANFHFPQDLIRLAAVAVQNTKQGCLHLKPWLRDILPQLSGQGIPTTGYAADIFFKGTSAYLGYQVNVGYKLTEMLSVAVGARFVSAKNTYEGYLKSIKINPTYPAFGTRFNGSMVLATDFFNAGATVP